jgi:hypothetical protein
MTTAETRSSLPAEVRQLIDETLAIVRDDAIHEMGQHRRRRIYEALWSSLPGEKACKWLAIMSARYVQPIYREGVSTSSYANDEFVVTLLDRMLDVAEKVVREELSPEDVQRAEKSGEVEDFYYSILVGAEKEFPLYIWLATLAAYNALLEAMGDKPLQNRISGEVPDEDGNTVITGSDTWTDNRLAGSGCHADDAAVDAAFTFAKLETRQQYDSGKVLEFWEWWLAEAIPQAWKRTLNT